MTWRFLTWVAGVLALGCASASAYFFIWPPTEEPGLVALDPDQHLGPQPPGRELTVNFRVENRTGRTLRVVGGPPFC
jgi:hypothetical protein